MRSRVHGDATAQQEDDSSFVAVIGMARRHPGAPDPGEFWQNLVRGTGAAQVPRVVRCGVLRPLAPGVPHHQPSAPGLPGTRGGRRWRTRAATRSPSRGPWASTRAAPTPRTRRPSGPAARSWAR
ncbi:beta-ketoacyl synthase N-terminal-like domain-containing protein [Kitasatospora sp. NA04385]|uniref:beta-ketoacyl synthase N-terminal-like domain-containing protein n=1 Tax=Kitasatospora sp. NA04385 TaxID=2742135 RepID=UPI0034CE6F68